MKHTKSAIQTKPTNNFALASVLMVLAATIGVQFANAQTPQTAKRANSNEVQRPAKLDGNIAFSSYYDDNVFNYSDSDRILIENSAVPSGRFQIDQIDDIVSSVAVRGDFVWNRKRRSFSRLRFRYDGALYQNNTFRNNNQFGVELKRNRRRSYTEISVTWKPNYYLRHLFWSTTKSSSPRPIGLPRYKAADLSKLSFYLEHQHRLMRRLHLRVTIGLELKDYASPFDERDNNTFSGALRLRKILSRRVEAFVGASVATVKASASDFNVVGIADIDNTEVTFNGGFKIRIDKRRRFIWEESVSYGHQSYNTSDMADRIHFNRSDDEFVLRSRLTWRVHPHWQPRVFYTLKTSTTDVLAGSADVGAFTSNRLGLQIITYF